MSSFPGQHQPHPLRPIQVLPQQPRQEASKLPLTRWLALQGHSPPEQKQLFALPKLTRILVGPLQNPLLLLLVNLDLLLLLTVIANQKKVIICQQNVIY